MNLTFLTMLQFLTTTPATTTPATWNDATNLPFNNIYGRLFVWISAIALAICGALRKHAQKKGKADAQVKHKDELDT